MLPFPQTPLRDVVSAANSLHSLLLRTQNIGSKSLHAKRTNEKHSGDDILPICSNVENFASLTGNQSICSWNNKSSREKQSGKSYQRNPAGYPWRCVAKAAFWQVFQPSETLNAYSCAFVSRIRV